MLGIFYNATENYTESHCSKGKNSTVPYYCENLKDSTILIWVGLILKNQTTFEFRVCKLNIGEVLILSKFTN